MSVSGKGSYVCLDCLKPKKMLSSTWCRSCSNRRTTTIRYENPEERKRQGDTLRNSSRYHAVHSSDAYRKHASKITKESWKNTRFMETHRKFMQDMWANPLKKAEIIESMNQSWLDPSRRERHGLAIREAYKRPDVLARVSGPNSHCWRGGVSFESYGKGFCSSLKTEIRERDKFLCQNCYLPENGKKHDIHHIDFNKKNNSHYNLITLCHSCHIRSSHGNRDYWKERYATLQESRGLTEHGKKKEE